ncbi:nectin-3-like protein [Hippocampus comes]|uniref:nectin-3-like protein n=1 Tax=Hippocampus comes TaxID=109280 RepID=UPI00094E0588|nr:PREDICTED: nectin-3-like protein [Hippocampus comes]
MEPLYGLFATLLVVHGLAGVSGNLVAAPAKVDAVLGKTITLGCHIQMMPNLTLIQTSWERQLPSGREVLAVYHVRHGTHISPEFAHRVSFVSTTDRDVSISMKGVDLADKGSYTCKVSTFPLGNDQASTDVNVLVEPKVYVSAGPAALLEGEGESLVATCIAERGLPAATVSWETELSGRVETQRREEADGTASVSVRYLWKPRGDAQGKNLTCVVRHPTLETDFRKDHTLNVHFAPTVLIKGEKKNWYAGQADVTLICDAQANPPVREYTWARWVGHMPDGVSAVSNRFAFTRPLTLNDSGVYRCEATNDMGVRSYDLSLWVQGNVPLRSQIDSLLGRDSRACTVPAAGTARSPSNSPTPAPARDDMLGMVVGGAAGAALVVILALLAVCFSFLRKRRTFRGDYYTKQYLGPSDMQKETQMDVLQPHELQEVYGEKSHNGSQELKSKLSADLIYGGEERGGGGDDWAERECDYFADGYRGQKPQHPCGPPVLANGSPYLPDDCRNNCADGDYVAHVDGSVISRREWYV